MNKSLPHVCVKCHKLKDAKLGEIRTRRGTHASRYFICHACIGVADSVPRGRDRAPSPDEREASRGACETGVFFKREHKVGSFFFDLAFPSLMLLVEVDSLTYHSHPSRRARDRAKQGMAEGLGWKVARVRRPDVSAQVRIAVERRAAELFD